MSIAHDTQKINLPSIDTFLRINPLPANLKHLEPAIRQLPSVEIMIETLVSSYKLGLNAEQTECLLGTLAEFFKEPSHRCVACLGWAANPCVSAMIDGNNFKILPICEKCQRLIESGRATRRMQSNVETYVGEVAR